MTSTSHDRVSGDLIDPDGNLTELGEQEYGRYLTGAVSLSAMKPVEAKDFWIIEGILARLGTTFVYGQSKMGKSFLVAQIIDAALTGNDLFGLTSFDSVSKVLIVVTDAGSDLEYKLRLDTLGVDTDRVDIKTVSGELDADDWNSLARGVAFSGYGLVVVDHATALVDGDMNQREGWRDLFLRLHDLEVPSVLVGHSTDSRFEGKQIKRPAGNAAVTQFARARVFLSSPGGTVNEEKRVLEFTSNNARVEPIECLRNEDGFLTVDGGAAVSSQNRSKEKVDAQERMIELALGLPAGLSQEAACERVSRALASERIYFEAGTIRTRLNKVETITWSRSEGRYLLK